MSYYDDFVEPNAGEPETRSLRVACPICDKVVASDKLIHHQAHSRLCRIKAEQRQEYLRRIAQLESEVERLREERDNAIDRARRLEEVCPLLPGD